jgi:hypothetical protein
VDNTMRAAWKCLQPYCANDLWLQKSSWHCYWGN